MSMVCKCDGSGLFPRCDRNGQGKCPKLQEKSGDWYVVHSYAGFEKRVKGNLMQRITSLHMEDFIFEIQVPEEEVTEIKNGQRKQVKRNVYPGYVLVRRIFNDIKRYKVHRN